MNPLLVRIAQHRISKRAQDERRLPIRGAVVRQEPTRGIGIIGRREPCGPRLLHERKVDGVGGGPNIHDRVPNRRVEIPVITLPVIIIVPRQAPVMLERMRRIQHAKVEARARLAGLVCALSEGTVGDDCDESGVDVEADFEGGGGVGDGDVVTVVGEEVVVCEGVKGGAGGADFA